MKITTNLGFKKPEASDFLSPDAFNYNFDVLDERLPKKADLGDDGKIPSSQVPSAATESALSGASTKDAPVDTDGLVLVDSEASGATKRILWSKIKTALSSVFAAKTHASQHGSSGSDPVTPADIGAYPNGIKGVVDCNTLTDGVWTISDSAKNVPGAFACTLFHKDWNAGFASQIAFGANRNVYYRVKTNGSWLAWQEMYSTLRYPSPSKIGAAESNHNHAGSSINPSSIEINPGTSTSHGGYIDFHYKGSTGDYTTRIIESASGKLDIDAPSGVYVSHPPVGTDALRNIQAGTTDLAAGSSSLATGAIYFVYE